MRGHRAATAQIVGEPLPDQSEHVLAFAILVARARMSAVAEVGGDRVARGDRVEPEQHALRLGQREEIVGEPLHLEHRHRVGGGVEPELLLPPDRAVAGEPVDDLPVQRIDRVRLHRVDPCVPLDQVVGIVRVWTIQSSTQPRDVKRVEQAQLRRAGRREREFGPAIRRQRVKQVAPGHDRHHGANPDRHSARAVESRLQKRQPGLPAAVGDADDPDRIGVQPEIRPIDDLPDHAAQVAELDVHVGQVHLSPGVAEAARRVAQHGVAVRDQRIGDVALAILAAAPSMQRRDQRVRPRAGRDHQGDVEQRAVDRAGEKAGAFAAAVRSGFTVQPRLRRPLAGAFADDAARALLAGAIGVGTEGLPHCLRVPRGEEHKCEYAGEPHSDLLLA